MENRILFKAGLRRHKSSLVGVLVLLFLVSTALGTVLTVWSNSGQYESAELTRTGFGAMTAWVSGVLYLDALTKEMTALPDVKAVETQEVIYANYTVREQESDSEGQLITVPAGDARYRFFTDDLSAYRTDAPQIAPGEVYVSPSLISMFGVSLGDEITFPIARAGGNVSFIVNGFPPGLHRICPYRSGHPRIYADPAKCFQRLVDCAGGSAAGRCTGGPEPQHWQHH